MDYADRKVLLETWVSFFREENFVGMSHVVLTFDLKRWVGTGVSVEGALFMWRRLVQALNESALHTKNYQRKVGHSYFGYVVGVEFHKSGVVHLHVVVDNWIDYALVHSWWNEHCGFAWTTELRAGVDDKKHGIRYALKYALKTGCDPVYFLQRRRREVSRGKLNVVSCAPREIVRRDVVNERCGIRKFM
jgi:hypothetical protein